MSTVLPVAPMQDQSTNLCSSNSTASLRQSSCQRDPNSCPSLCFLFVFVLHQFVKSSLPFLAVLFALSFTLALTFSLTWIAFALACVLLAFARAGLAFDFIVRSRPSIRLIVLPVLSSLWTISHHVTVGSTPYTVSLELLILTAHLGRIHRNKLCVSSC